MFWRLFVDFFFVLIYRILFLLNNVNFCLRMWMRMMGCEIDWQCSINKNNLKGIFIVFNCYCFHRAKLCHYHCSPLSFKPYYDQGPIKCVLINVQNIKYTRKIYNIVALKRKYLQWKLIKNLSDFRIFRTFLFEQHCFNFIVTDS